MDSIESSIPRVSLISGSCAPGVRAVGGGGSRGWLPEPARSARAAMVLLLHLFFVDSFLLTRQSQPQAQKETTFQP